MRRREFITVLGGAAATVGGGLVSSLAHPGGNVTGFTNIESSMSAKWLQLHPLATDHQPDSALSV